MSLNNDIARHAKRKQLEQAMVLFDTACSCGAANSHTFAAAVNANILCGDVKGAERVMDIMSNMGRKRDVIICTTMMKGYCGEGNLKKGLELLQSMTTQKPIVAPNIRTINTLLRGCIQVGDCDAAEHLVNLATKELKLKLDASSWEYYVTLLCQSLNLDKVLPIIGRLKSESNLVPKSSLVSMHLCVARASALLFDWKLCRRSLAAATLNMDEGSSLTSEIGRKDGSESLGATVVAGGGKRAWRSESSRPSVSDTEGIHGYITMEHRLQQERRAQSLQVFREHSLAEQRAEIAIIERFIYNMTTIGTQQHGRKAEQTETSEASTRSARPAAAAVAVVSLPAMRFTFPHLLQFITIPASITYDTARLNPASVAGGTWREYVAGEVADAVGTNFGVQQLALRHFPAAVVGSATKAFVAAAEADQLQRLKLKSKKDKKHKKHKKKSKQFKPGDESSSSVSPPQQQGDVKSSSQAKSSLPLFNDIYRNLVKNEFDAEGYLDFDRIFSQAAAVAEIVECGSTEAPEGAKAATSAAKADASTDTIVTNRSSMDSVSGSYLGQLFDLSKQRLTAGDTGSVGASGSGAAQQTQTRRPLKLEVCSGAGEWAVAQVKIIDQLYANNNTNIVFELLAFG